MMVSAASGVFYADCPTANLKQVIRREETNVDTAQARAPTE
jgi:hypothetical protein